MKESNKTFFKRLFLFYIGFVTYLGIEVCFRGHSYPLMGLLGGIAIAFVLDPINNRISFDIPLIMQMFIGSVIITGLEALFGYFGLYVLGIRMWDYSNMWMNMCDGFICPLFSFCWMLLSGVGIVLADAINYYMFHENPRPYYNRINGNLWFMLPERECEHNDN